MRFSRVLGNAAGFPSRSVVTYECRLRPSRRQSVDRGADEEECDEERTNGGGGGRVGLRVEMDVGI